MEEVFAHHFERLSDSCAMRADVLAGGNTSDVIIPHLASPSVCCRRGWFPSSYCQALSEPLANNNR